MSTAVPLPAYLLARPPMPKAAATRARFEALADMAMAAGGAHIAYALRPPIWQFLSYLADTRAVLLHGSGRPDISRFEPRQPHDATEFGNQNAVYAASDGLWPMYFAILDRDRFAMSLVNSSVRMEVGDGRLSPPHYFFSISREALAKRPFRTGTIYVLPRAGFVQQAPIVAGGRRVHLAHWASLDPVAPLARFTVRPEDFPFLGQIRGHDDEVTFARARANPDGFPWLDEGKG